MTEYNTIIERSQGIYKEKGSKFISFAVPVATEEEIKNTLELMRKKYHDARHICYAYIIGENEKTVRSNDDGEPAGTAGKQILKQIEIKDLTNILVVVIRYFGGILLGTGPLSQAYREATMDALTNNTIVKKEIQSKWKIIFPYDQLNTVMVLLKKQQINVIKQEIESQCTIIAQIPKTSEKLILEKLHGIDSIKIQIIS